MTKDEYAKQHDDTIGKLRLLKEQMTGLIVFIDGLDKEYAEVLEAEFPTAKGDKIRITDDSGVSWSGSYSTFEGYYDGIEAEDNYTGSCRFRPVLYRCKKDGSRSKNKMSYVPYIEHILKVEKIADEK